MRLNRLINEVALLWGKMKKDKNQSSICEYTSDARCQPQGNTTTMSVLQRNVITKSFKWMCQQVSVTMTKLHGGVIIKNLKWLILLACLIIGLAIYQQFTTPLVTMRASTPDTVTSQQQENCTQKEFDFQKAMDELNKAKVAQDDPRLIKLIRDHYLVPPSPHSYNLENPTHKDVSREGFGASVHRKWLNNMTGGFFIEGGAFDGEFISNTLYLEREHNWRGLLIEVDPVPYAKLLKKNRNAYCMNACMSTKPYPSVMNYSSMAAFGRLADNEAALNYTKHYSQGMPLDTIQVQCFPLYSILLAIGQLTVDFFSLDVNGSELDLLKTVPLQKANLSLILLEFSHVDGGLPAITTYLRSQGYNVLETHIEDVLVKNNQLWYTH